MVKTEEIKQAYEFWKNAVIKGDRVSLNNIYTENFLWTNCMGIMKNKTENLNKISSRDIQYLSWMNEDMTVNIVGDIASLKTREILKIIVYDQRINTVRDVTVIFINQSGEWKLAGGEESNVN